MDVLKSKSQRGAVWKQQVHDHFSDTQLSEADVSRLTDVLMAAPKPLETHITLPANAAVARGRFRHNSMILAKRMHRLGVGYLLTAVASAAATLGFFVPTDEPSDPIADLASLPGPRYYPADFDLEGDPTAFKGIMQDVFSSPDAFVAEIPRDIQARYHPSEGRLFVWSGEPGVSIQLKALGATGLVSAAQPATLYIVKLSTDRAERKFPKAGVTKRIKGSAGKGKKVNVWREGKYGYAMVQSVALNE